MKVTPESFEKMLYYFMAHHNYGEFKVFNVAGGKYQIMTPSGCDCDFYLNKREDGEYEIVYFKIGRDYTGAAMRLKNIEDFLIQVNAWHYPIFEKAHYVRFSSFDWDNLITFGNPMGGLKTCLERWVDARNSELRN